MPPLSLRDAATAAGTSKSTILRAIQSGRMSAPRTDDGGYAIDPAELFRVYPPKATDSDATHHSPHHGVGHDATDRGSVEDESATDATELRIRNAALEAQLTALRDILAIEKERAAELRSDRDRWAAQAERLALPAPAPAPTTVAFRWPWSRSA